MWRRDPASPCQGSFCIDDRLTGHYPKVGADIHTFNTVSHLTSSLYSLESLFFKQKTPWTCPDAEVEDSLRDGIQHTASVTGRKFSVCVFCCPLFNKILYIILLLSQ